MSSDSSSDAPPKLSEDAESREVAKQSEATVVDASVENVESKETEKQLEAAVVNVSIEEVPEKPKEEVPESDMKQETPADIYLGGSNAPPRLDVENYNENIMEEGNYGGNPYAEGAQGQNNFYLQQGVPQEGDGVPPDQQMNQDNKIEGDENKEDEDKKDANVEGGK